MIKVGVLVYNVHNCLRESKKNPSKISNVQTFQASKKKRRNPFRGNKQIPKGHVYRIPS